MQETEFLRPAEIAPLLGVSKQRIYQLISDKTLPHAVIGGAIRIPRTAWETWLAERSQDALAVVGKGGTSDSAER